ncbi:hypothetical protein EVAR_57126_1 [Eumeta japonica]|uniref:Uncharacterized protein n=1 Tax=Eumeta variegata TaxID=151549 RepID=A0A4C1YSW3_EUMVA|nr:hypothetical protein EVAR_57126_1 [Eumeta japonica]
MSCRYTNYITRSVPRGTPSSVSPGRRRGINDDGRQQLPALGRHEGLRDSTAFGTTVKQNMAKFESAN